MPWYRNGVPFHLILYLLSARRSLRSRYSLYQFNDQGRAKDAPQTARLYPAQLDTQDVNHSAIVPLANCHTGAPVLDTAMLRYPQAR